MNTQLSLEQQLSLRMFKEHVKTLSEDEVKLLLLDKFKQSMLVHNMYVEHLKSKL